MLRRPYRNPPPITDCALNVSSTQNHPFWVFIARQNSPKSKVRAFFVEHAKSAILNWQTAGFWLDFGCANFDVLFLCDGIRHFCNQHMIRVVIFAKNSYLILFLIYCSFAAQFLCAKMAQLLCFHTQILSIKWAVNQQTISNMNSSRGVLHKP